MGIALKVTQTLYHKKNNNKETSRSIKKVGFLLVSFLVSYLRLRTSFLKAS